MRPARRHLASATSALALVAVLAACGSHDTAGPGADHGEMSTSAGAHPSARDGSGDVAFAQRMIPHHEQAVQMAELALARTDLSAQVRALATQIRQAQAPEIATMTAWLKGWGAPQPTAGAGHDDHGADGMMTEADLADLAEARGADFDQMWLTMMIAHHEGAVTMSKSVLGTTRDARVRSLAEAIAAAQQQEISTMRALQP